MKKTTKRIGSALLAMSMAAALIPAGLGAVVNADEPSGKAMKTSLDKNDVFILGKTTEKANYDGTTRDTPVKWRVLDEKKTNTGIKGMFVLAEDVLGDKDGAMMFHGSEDKNNEYEYSYMHSWCDDFFSSGFDSKEKAIVMATSKTDYEKEIIEGTFLQTGATFSKAEKILNNNYVFPLSAEEVDKYIPINSRNAKYNGSVASWWLRSADKNDSSNVGYLKPIGEYSYIGTMDVTEKCYARPAMNINPANILFASAVKNGKKTGTDNNNKIIPVEDYTGDEWKLTLHDSSLDGLVIEDVVNNGDGTAKITYSGAKGDYYNYLSGIVKDSDGNITGYGQIKNVITYGYRDDSSGSVTVKIPKDGTLYLFVEVLRDKSSFDYAGNPTAIKIPIIPVKNIKDGPTKATAGTDLELKATVLPENASNKEIVWSVKDAGTTGATIDGNVLKTTAPGTVKVTATIKKGAIAPTSVGSLIDISADFEITVSKSAEQIAAEKKAADDKAAADEVAKMISDIGSVTEVNDATKAKLDKVKEAYDKLSEDQKKLVTNYNIYVTLQTVYTELEKKAEAAPTDKEEPTEVTSKGITYKVLSADDKTASVVKADAEIKTASIKGSVKIGKVSYKVTAIEKNAFKGCAALTKVSGGANIETIGANAFSGCKALKSFAISSKTLKSIGSSAFKGDKKLKTIKIDKTTKLTKKGVKNALKGSSVKTVDVAKKQVKSFKKFFTKSNAGLKVTVK